MRTHTLGLPRSGVLLLIALAAPIAALAFMSQPVRATASFSVGDVFVGIGDGKVGHFSNTGTLLDTLDSTHAGSESAGMCFDQAGNLYAAFFEADTLSKFGPDGTLLVAGFGSGYGANPESCSFNSTNQLYVGQAGGTHKILKFDASGNPLASYTPTSVDLGTDWIDLAADECSMVYAGEGATIRRFNVCTNAAGPDFATGLPAPCFAVRTRLNGEVMVACASGVRRLSSTGMVLQTYLDSSLNPQPSKLFALNLDPDGTTFWTADLNSGDVYRVNISTGAQVTHFKPAFTRSVAGLAIFGEQRVATPPSEPASPAAPVTASSPPVLYLLVVAAGAAILFLALFLRRRRRPVSTDST
jgi:hypothetical protein